jgi:hypothetical protein
MELSGSFVRWVTHGVRTIRTPRRARAGLTLFELIVTVLACTVLTIAVWWYGPLQVAAAIRRGMVFLAVVVVWGSVYTRAPDLTRNASVVLLLGFLALALVPGLLQNSREQARRTQCKNSLRQIGVNLHADEYARTPPLRDREDRF